MRLHQFRKRSLGALPSALALAAIISVLPSSATAQSEVSPGDLERALAVAEDLSIAFEHVGNSVTPAVVNVRATIRVQANRLSPLRPFGGDPFRNSPFRDFFGDDFFERFDAPRQPRQPQEFLRQGQGTGFIVSEDGYILTNNHVVADAAEVTVQLSSGREYRARIVGTDPSTDLAVLKIDAEGLVALRFGDSDALRVGSWVVAVGNPFGLQSTITAGIVSAKGRSRVGIADYEDFIQTDAAINPGNSGGPLVNLRGEVVGVNTAIATRSGGNMGIGFAIPSNMAMSIMDTLREDGVVTRGRLGVSIQDLDDDLAASFGFESRSGVLVADVEDPSPAASAGLRSGDIIMSFDGVAMSSGDQLRLRVAGTAPGRVVPVKIFRDGRERTINVTVGRLESQTPVAGESGESKEQLAEKLGVQLRDIDDQIASQLGLPLGSDGSASARGILVAAVEPMGIAARAGLRPRDIITHVHGERIATVDEFGTAMAQHDLARGVRLTVRTDAFQRFVILRDTTR